MKHCGDVAMLVQRTLEGPMWRLPTVDWIQERNIQDKFKRESKREKRNAQTPANTLHRPARNLMIWQAGIGRPAIQGKQTQGKLWVSKLRVKVGWKLGQTSFKANYLFQYMCFTGMYRKKGRREAAKLIFNPPELVGNLPRTSGKHNSQSKANPPETCQ